MQGYEFLRKLLHCLYIGRGPPKVDLDILSLHPSQLRKLLPQSRHPSLGHWIAFVEGQQCADTPQPALRPRRERQCRSRRAPDQRDELAALHSITSSASASSLSGTFKPSALAV